MAGTYDLHIDQGASLTRAITWTASDGSPVDLTGYTGAAQIRASAQDASPLVSLTVTFDADRTTGKLSVSLTSAQTAALVTTGTTATDRTKGVWDLELTSGSGTVTRLLQGAVFISPEVTR